MQERCVPGGASLRELRVCIPYLYFTVYPGMHGVPGKQNIPVHMYRTSMCKHINRVYYFIQDKKPTRRKLR